MYLKSETTITRYVDVLGKSFQETRVNTTLSGKNIDKLQHSANNLECAFACFLKGVDCVGAKRIHDDEVNGGSCILKSEIENVEKSINSDIIRVHRNPLEPLHNCIKTFTRYEKKFCDGQEIMNYNYLNKYQCAEMCHTVADCIGFTTKNGSEKCILKSTCDPGSLETSSEHETYIMKTKQICNYGGHCYTPLPDQQMNMESAKNACSARDQYILTLETEEEFNHFLNLLNNHSFASSMNPIWLSLDPDTGQWEIGSTDLESVSWSLPWQYDHPVSGRRCSTLDQETGEFVSNYQRDSHTVVCEANGPYIIYGGDGLNIGGVNDESYFSTLHDLNMGSCLTLGDKKPASIH